MRHRLRFLLFMLVLNLTVFSQERTISGVITNYEGERLEHVKVVALTSTIESYANEEGYYEITVPTSESTLEFFLKDFVKTSITIGVHDEINITMTSEKIDTYFDLPLEELMNIQVTTASKKAEKSTDAPGIITVVSKDELARFGGNSLEEILNRIVTSYSISNHLIKSIVSLRGDQSNETSNHILVLINGRPSREGIWGGIDSDIYQSFPVSAIDHIEVVRGPGSVLYGTNAFTGVINIITKQDDNSYFEANAMGIAEGGYGGDITGNLAKGELQAFGSLRYIKKPSFHIDEYMVFNPQLGELESSPFSTADTSIGAFFGINYKNASAMFAYSDWETSDSRTFRYKRVFSDIGYRIDITKAWKVDVNGTFNKFEQASFISRYSTELLGEFTNHFDISEDINLVLGGSYTYIDGKEEALSNDIPDVSMDSTESSYSIYSQIQYQIIDNLKLIAGFQYNKVEKSDGDVVPRLGIVYYPLKKLNLKILYAQAYSAPSLGEKFLSDPRNQGNPFLLPEKVNSLDLSATWFSDKVESSLSYFIAVQNNLISRTDSGGFGNLETFANINNLTLQGIEWENKYYLNPKVLFTLNSSYLINKQDSLRNVTPIPIFMLKFGVSYMNKNGITVSIFNIYNGNYADDNRYSNIGLNQQYAAHNLLNLHANLELNKLLNLSLQPDFNFYVHGENLLNTQVWNPNYVANQTRPNFSNRLHSPHIGRMLYIGLKVKFE